MLIDLHRIFAAPAKLVCDQNWIRGIEILLTKKTERACIFIALSSCMGIINHLQIVVKSFQKVL